MKIRFDQQGNHFPETFAVGWDGHTFKEDYSFRGRLEYIGFHFGQKDNYPYSQVFVMWKDTQTDAIFFSDWDMLDSLLIESRHHTFVTAHGTFSVTALFGFKEDPTGNGDTYLVVIDDDIIVNPNHAK